MAAAFAKASASQGGQDFCQRSICWIWQVVEFAGEIDKSEGNDYIEYR